MYETTAACKASRAKAKAKGINPGNEALANLALAALIAVPALIGGTAIYAMIAVRSPGGALHEPPAPAPVATPAPARVTLSAEDQAYINQLRWENAQIKARTYRGLELENERLKSEHSKF